MALLLLLLACNGDAQAPATAAPSRTEGVTVSTQKKQRSLDDFCEKHDAAATAATLTWPELDGAAPPRSSKWTWVNVWATWCGPCVAEMPMIKQWQAKLASEGVDVDLAYLSVDANAEDVTRFRAAHTDAPAGPRVKDYALVAPWVSSIGLDASAVIPIHVFVDPDQKIRCTRLGALEGADYAEVKRVLKGE